MDPYRTQEPDHRVRLHYCAERLQDAVKAYVVSLEAHVAARTFATLRELLRAEAELKNSQTEFDNAVIEFAGF